MSTGDGKTAKAAKAKKKTTQVKNTAKAPATKTEHASAAGKKATKNARHKLVIVESPAKARTIGKFLGRTYKVVASNGHVRDLPKSQLGVDTENDFEPKYITIRGRGDVLEEIRKEAKNASGILLATDPDREGEAISWHLSGILGIDPSSACRVEFNEITSKTVKDSVKKPRAVNMQLVDAQQARRVLDRLVGYKISPLFWAKIRKGLSAGRVQSVATRMIVDREQEIAAFIPEEYWTIDARFDEDLTARLTQLEGGKPRPGSGEEAAETVRRLKAGKYTVQMVRRGERKRHPVPPFTTSNLQQEAGRRLGFTTAKTMQVAQQLYEGVDIAGHGTQGLISYIRTDSVRLSDEAVSLAREAIAKRYGESYVPEKPNVYRGRGNAQDAHEAIRPTNLDLLPDDIAGSLTRDQLRLYRLIYTRFLACQMSDAVYETQQVEIASDNGATLRMNAEKLKFAGFTAVYEVPDENKEERETNRFADVSEGQALTLSDVLPEQHFTQPPPRYTEASLVRAMEDLGIGRPSTYAPTISTIIARGYVLREKKQLVPSELGVMTTDLLKEYFTDIVDCDFTAELEEQLDDVEAGKREWHSVVKDFYGPFEKTLENAEAHIEKIEPAVEESDVICDKCGARMVYKMGRFGKFLACPNFPACRNTKNIQQEIKAPCPKCGAKLLEKHSKRGKVFYGCEHWPDCDFVSWDPPIEEHCPKCGSYMVLKETRRGRFQVCANEQCRYRAELPEEPSE